MQPLPAHDPESGAAKLRSWTAFLAREMLVSGACSDVPEAFARAAAFWDEVERREDAAAEPLDAARPPMST